MAVNFEILYQKYGALAEEVNRRKRKIKIISNILVTICIAITFYIVYKNDIFSDEAETYLKFGMFIALLIYGQRYYMIKKLNSKYKQAVLPALLSFIDYDLQYDAEKGHTEEEFKKIKLYEGRVDRFSSSDLMEGKIDKTFMKISYIVASEKNKTGKKTTYIPIFEGTIVSFDFNKYFSGKTKIYTNSFFNKLEVSISDDKYEKITLENQDFNDAFVVYTTDIQEALYILTPELVEHIMNIQSFDGVAREINISFIDNMMYIAFEETRFLDMDKTDDYKMQIQLFYNEIKHMINIVEILELNNRIWTKQ